MKLYKVTGRLTWLHSCSCRYCTMPASQSIDVSVIVPGPDEYDEFGDKSDIEDAALEKQYQEMGLVLETDSLFWNNQERQVREANQDEIMAAMGAPRLPGF